MNFKASFNQVGVGLLLLVMAITSTYFDYVTRNYRLLLMVGLVGSVSLVVIALASTIKALKAEVDELKKALPPSRG